MKIALLVSNLVLVAALLVSLLVARAQHVRAQEAMERAMNAQAVALEAAERARDAATPHGPVVGEGRDGGLASRARLALVDDHVDREVLVVGRVGLGQAPTPSFSLCSR